MVNDHKDRVQTNSDVSEMLFFVVNNKEYAIPICEVDEIIPIDNVIGVPDSHPSVMGLAMVRNEVLTIIDMSMVLDKVKMGTCEDKIMLKAHHQNIHLAFCVDEIIGIRRVEGNQIETNSELTNQLVRANIKVENKIYMLLNYDKIVADIKSQ